MIKFNKLSKAVAIASLPFLAAGPSMVMAQQAPESTEAGQLEEITVSARRRTENLQDVPMSVEAFNESAIESLNVYKFSDLASQVPNLTFVRGESGRLNTPIIRGMALIDSRGFDNNVGVFIDGVFVSGRAAQNIGLVDLQRVEVVKGPQSALYGRNTFAGAVNFVTKDPSDTFEGNVEATIGEDNLTRVQAAISGPIIEDRLSGRLALSYMDDEGTYKNIGPQDKNGGIGGAKSETVMGTLLFTPNDSTRIFLDAYYSDEDVDGRALEIVDNNCGEIVPTFTSLTYDIGVPYYACGETPNYSGEMVDQSPGAYSSKGDTYRGDLRMDFEIGDYTLHSITAYTKNQSNGFADLDRSQVGGAHYGYAKRSDYEARPSYLPPVLFPDAPYIPGWVEVTDADFNTFIGSQGLDQKYWSQELRLDSASDQRLRWSAGLYYFHSENDQSSDLAIDVSSAVDATGLSPDELVFMTVDPAGGPGPYPWLGPANPPGRLALPHPLLGQQYEVDTDLWSDGVRGPQQLTISTETVDQYSIFGSLEYDFTDKLTGTVELRYTEETRSLEDIKDDFFFTVPPGESNYNEVSFEFWDPRFTLRYAMNDDIMIYGSVAKGTRSGGVNGNIPEADPDILTYDPETNWTYELGIKNSWLDNRLQLNAAIFYVDWEDAQFRQRLTDSTGAFLTATSNSTGLTSKGFEISIVAQPTEHWNISGGYGYADVTFDDGTLYSGGAALCRLQPADNSDYPVLPINCVLDPAGSGDSFPDMSGLQPRRSSDTTANFATTYTRPLGDSLDWFAQADASYRSKQYMDEINVTYVPARSIANMSLGINAESWGVTLWVKNMFEEDAPEFAQVFQSDLNSFLPVTTIVGIERRRIGITARYRF
ncbi:MAG: TonB-dependent receptor [Pseudomonadales bacterium]